MQGNLKNRMHKVKGEAQLPFLVTCQKLEEGDELSDQTQRFTALLTTENLKI